MQTYEWHPIRNGITPFAYWLSCAFALVCGSAAVIVAVRYPDSRWTIGTIGSLFIVCGVGMLFRTETVLHPDSRTVCRRLRFVGRFLVWSRTYEFSDFTAITLRRVRSASSDDPSDSYFVSMRRRSGRQLRISYFQGNGFGGCRPAEELAHKLSADLQLEIEEQNT